MLRFLNQPATNSPVSGNPQRTHQYPAIRNDDPKWEPDNHLIEIKIRPLTLGRDNYLFAGSYKATQRIAMMDSIFATCKANELNPYEWMKETMERLPDTKLYSLDQLIPKKQRV